MQHVSNIQYVYLLNKYLKCSVWRLALLYDVYIYIYIYIYISLGFKRLRRVELYLYRPSGSSWPVLERTVSLPLLLTLVTKHGSKHVAIW